MDLCNIKTALGVTTTKYNKCDWNYVQKVVTTEGWQGLFLREVMSFDTEGNYHNLLTNKRSGIYCGIPVHKEAFLAMNMEPRILSTLISDQKCANPELVEEKYLKQSLNLALWYACNINDEHKVNSLLLKGANPDFSGFISEINPKKLLNFRCGIIFLEACAKGFYNIVSLLLPYANPNLEPEFSITPLFCAVEHGHLGIVNLLLSDVRVQGRKRALYIACREKNLDVNIINTLLNDPIACSKSLEVLNDLVYSFKSSGLEHLHKAIKLLANDSRVLQSDDDLEDWKDFISEMSRYTLRELSQIIA